MRKIIKLLTVYNRRKLDILNRRKWIIKLLTVRSSVVRFLIGWNRVVAKTQENLILASEAQQLTPNGRHN